MKIATALVTAFVLPMMLFSSAATAQLGIDCESDAYKGTEICRDFNKGKGQTAYSNDILRVLALVVDVLAMVVGVASVIVIIVAGIQFTTSGGSPEAVGKARKAIIYGLVGLVVTIAARQIIVFILSRL